MPVFQFQRNLVPICAIKVFAFTKKAYKKVVWESNGYGVETEIVVKTGKNKLKYDEVPIEAKYLDKYKGASILDAISILPSILKWKFLV